MIQSPIYIDLFTALGANPVPMPFPELYTALETGTVDGQENPFSNIISRQDVRGAEVPYDHQSHVQPADRDHLQEDLGQDERG